MGMFMNDPLALAKRADEPLYVNPKARGRQHAIQRTIFGVPADIKTGHRAICTVHGTDCRSGLEKMADYIAQATGYSMALANRQLTGFQHVIFLNEYQVDEIVRVEGWDPVTEDLRLRSIYKIREAA